MPIAYKLIKTATFWDNFPNIKKNIKESEIYNYTELVDIYIDTIGRSWSNTTQKTEASKLKALTTIINTFGLSPADIYRELIAKGYTQYTISARFTRLRHFFKFLLDAEFIGSGINPFESYMKFYDRKFFKNAYNRELGVISREEALEKIALLTTSEQREHVMFLLNSGLRLEESYNVISDGAGGFIVKSKGGKIRRVYISPPKALVNKSTLQKALNKVGLKAHTLRKLCATNLANKGCSNMDLLKIMGWSKLETAQLYLQPKNDDHIKQMMIEKR